MGGWCVGAERERGESRPRATALQRAAAAESIFERERGMRAGVLARARVLYRSLRGGGFVGPCGLFQTRFFGRWDRERTRSVEFWVERGAEWDYGSGVFRGALIFASIVAGA